jgi:hypothetical protein
MYELLYWERVKNRNLGFQTRNLGFQTKDTNNYLLHRRKFRKIYGKNYIIFYKI